MDISTLSNYFELYGGMAIFLVVLLEYMNLPGFPAGIILPLAGIYAAHGGLNLFLAIAISVLAGEVGSWILYFLGMYGGNAFMNMYLKRFPKHKPAVEHTFDLIRRNGFYGIFISKLIPMVRTLISIPAGVLKMEFVKYSIASFLGITLWNTLFVGAGYIIGEPVLNIITRGENMRIAMMTNNYKPFVGGVPISIERLADSLRDLGHTVYVFAPDYKSPMDDDAYTFRFPTMKHKIAGAIPVPNLIYSYVKKTISTLHIDLIHVHHPWMIGNVATRIGKEFHIPVVFTYHTRYEQYLHYLKPFGYLQNQAGQGNRMAASILDFAQRQVIQRYLNNFLEKCDMVFAPTKSIQDYLKPFHIDTPINIAPTGLPHVCFEKHIEATDIREKYLQGKQYLFCTVSRLAKEKNLPFLLRGVAAVKEQLGDIFNLLILGDGPEKENLMALSRTLNIDRNVFFVGEVPNQKISSYHQACDLFLFSSKSETQGIVLLEAMAAYLPVFAIRATGVSDVVNGKNGVLSSDSLAEWVENLISILQNPAVLIKMKSSARNTALLYDEKIIANQILERYTYLKMSYEAEHCLMLHLNGTSQTERGWNIEDKSRMDLLSDLRK